MTLASIYSLYLLFLISPSLPSYSQLSNTELIMPNSSTPNAPKDYDELIKLLENDTKVKVAGKLITP